ncbi:MAG TPA: hypothetical protein VGL94_19725 [Ktedonobacteraceae bacterium]
MSEVVGHTHCLELGRQDSTIDIWDTSKGELIQTYRGHSSLIEAIAWSPDGSYLASGDHQGTAMCSNWGERGCPLLPTIYVPPRA